MDLKSRISTPLEAGTSILDVHRLPSYLVPALAYASKRLAEKGLHLTFVVARRDYQLPGYAMASKAVTVSSPGCARAAPPTPPCSPPSLVRSQSEKVPQSTFEPPGFARPIRSQTGPLSKKSPLASLFDASLGSPRLRWTPTSNASSFPPRTPKTPMTPASCVTATSTTSSVACGSLGSQGPAIHLIHTTPLAPRTYKLVAATLARASRKFNLATTLTAHEASTYNLPTAVLHSSILQNEVLHMLDGITLLSLDHLYTFKSALSHYAAIRTEPGSHFALEDAVDELRRYVLSSTAGRRKLLKSTLVQAFDWLGPVNETALAEVTIMYSRAYGTATDTGVADDLVHVATTETTLEPTSEALSKGVCKFAEARTAVLTPELPLRSAARMTRYSLDAVISGADSPSAITPVLASIEKQEDASDEDDEGNKTPVPTHPPQTSQQQTLATPPLTPHLPSPKIRPSAPTLKLQTSFPAPALHKPTPKRKKTPLPTSNKRHSRTSNVPLPAPTLSMPIFLSPTTADDASLSSRDDNIRFELTTPVVADDAASVQTDFEDAELTARSPCAGAKTPGGSIWLGIDDILSGGGGGGGSSGFYNGVGGRRRSSEMFLQTPAGDKVGPMTPNGCDDISPVTRGEWGLLMVGESFQTRRAGVSCV